MTTQINLGATSLAHHAPVTHGYTKFDLELDGDKVVSAKPILGSMHRGVEKLFESRDYRQILMLANRHEWLGSFAGELGVAQLVEDALGIEVPESAQWLRTLLLEYTRITSHLAFIAGFPWSDDHLPLELRNVREIWIKHIANYTGNRMHPMITRIGGLSHAPTSDWLDQLPNLIKQTNEVTGKNLPELNKQLAQFAGVGILAKETAIEFSVSGPVARASGYQIDLRANARGLKYSELSPNDISFSYGDVASRIGLLIAEIGQSLTWLGELIPICKSKVEEPIDVLLPKVLRVPVGVYEHEIETPLGIASWLLISTNDKMPNRLKLRPASLHTLLATSEVLKGVNGNQLDAVIASMPFISGDVDR